MVYFEIKWFSWKKLSVLVGRPIPKWHFFYPQIKIRIMYIMLNRIIKSKYTLSGYLLINLEFDLRPTYSPWMVMITRR